MSKAAIKWARTIKLWGAANAVLKELAIRADEKQGHSCYPGQDTIASDTGLSLSTVRRALHVIEDAGLVLIERRFDNGGHRTSDRYWLQLDVTDSPTRPARKKRATPTGETAITEVTTDTQPVENSPTGQIDLRSTCTSLPVNLHIPTGQVDRYIGMNKKGEKKEEGASAAPTTRTCGQHPDGTDRPCRGCQTARIRWEAANAQPAAAPRASRYPADVYCEHLQLRTTECEACAEDARSAIRNAGYLLGAAS